MANSSADVTTHDFQSLLSSPGRDFLVRNNGDQVKIDSLKGKKLGFYFSLCCWGQRFTHILVEVYNKVSQNNDFEVIFVTSAVNDESFKRYFCKMPWLAIPFSDSETHNRLEELFNVREYPQLALVDETGKVVTEDLVGIIREYGVEGYPFTSERIQELKIRGEEAKTNQSLRSILSSDSLNFVISANGKKIPISQLEGKTVGLYFCDASYKSCNDFSKQLKEIYEMLKAVEENFEIVTIPVDDDDETFKKEFESMPWLSLPINDKRCEKLLEYFQPADWFTLVIIGPDGKTLHPNVVEVVKYHGIDAYPFTPEKFAALDEIEKSKDEAQTLESILVFENQDFVISKDRVKIPVSELKGKTVLLYFSASKPSDHKFLTELSDAYERIKEKHKAIEVVFISSDKDQASFDEIFSEMPWLALPFGDSRKAFLDRKFKVSIKPMLVAIGPSGRTITKEARNLVTLYGEASYPFTEERIKEIEAQYCDIANWLPEKLLQRKTHDHELELTCRGVYKCDDCNEEGHMWSYCCHECDIYLLPQCALWRTMKSLSHPYFRRLYFHRLA